MSTESARTHSGTTESREAVSVDPGGLNGAVVAEAGLRRISIGGVDVTPYVSRVEAHQADADWCVIDETHIWRQG